MLRTSAVGLSDVVKALDQPRKLDCMTARLTPQRQDLVIV
jgi:hypothetical protein